MLRGIPNGVIIASGSKDETVKLWDVIDGEEKDTLEHQSLVASVVWSPNGAKLRQRRFLQFFESLGCE